jgi:hypothetical protein
MANGFGEGYCGMQVNSAKERRILFSVWSPFHTNDPKAIPEGERITLLAKGKAVQAQAFGGEGSGGQSYLIYPWKAGTVYRFLLHGEPAGDGTTVYTAYFYPPEEGKWLLLASFKRPKTDTYLTRWHSFLENFSPDMGAVTEREITPTNGPAISRAGGSQRPKQSSRPTPPPTRAPAWTTPAGQLLTAASSCATAASSATGAPPAQRSPVPRRVSPHPSSVSTNFQGVRLRFRTNASNPKGTHV